MNENHPTTERLYFSNSHLLQFEAEVLACYEKDNHWLALLDRTAFYPTGGGQPNDTGKLGDANLIDCIDNETHIIHVIDRAISGSVKGVIDPLRRRDHMQQHTGQHILSQAFINIAGAETKGFHLGTESATIDLAIDNLTAEQLLRAEDLANSIVFEDRPIKIHITDKDGAEQFALRKETERTDCVRIIEIEEFDHSPCGGTHAHRTGEVGLIVIRSIERAKKMVRVEFLCGMRALNDYRAAHKTAMATASLFSALRDTAPELVSKLQQDHKQLQRRNRELLELALMGEAKQLFDNASIYNNVRIIHQIFSGRDLEEIKLLGHLTIALGDVLVLFAGCDESVRVVFARSKGLTEDCGKLLNNFCQALGGRGGGRPDFAQGGVPITSKWQDALTTLVNNLQNK